MESKKYGGSCDRRTKRCGGGCDRRTKHSQEELPHIQGQGQKPEGPHARRAVAKRSDPTSEGRGSGREYQWALGSISTNKASGRDGIPVELFQVLKDDAVKVLHSRCQQIWKTQQWPQDWKTSVFIPVV